MTQEGRDNKGCFVKGNKAACKEKKGINLAQYIMENTNDLEDCANVCITMLTADLKNKEDRQDRRFALNFLVDRAIGKAKISVDSTNELNIIIGKPLLEDTD